MLWVRGDLRAASDAVIKVTEAWDISSIKSAAAEISPEALAMVTAKAPWTPALKDQLVQATDGLAVKYLNKTGVSAENKEEVTLATLLPLLILERMSLRKTLREMAEAKQVAKPTPLEKAMERGPREPLPVVKKEPFDPNDIRNL